MKHKPIANPNFCAIHESLLFRIVDTLPHDVKAVWIHWLRDKQKPQLCAEQSWRGRSGTSRKYPIQVFHVHDTHEIFDKDTMADASVQRLLLEILRVAKSDQKPMRGTSTIGSLMGGLGYWLKRECTQEDLLASRMIFLTEPSIYKTGFHIDACADCTVIPAL